MLSKIYDTLTSTLQSYFPNSHKQVLLLALALGFAKFFSNLFNYIWSLRPNRFDINKYGNGYVVITGATQGIGKGFAQYFCKNGCNLVLVGRNSQKLETLARELRNINQIDIRLITADFKYAMDSDFPAKFDQLLDLPISLLVNNVGICQIRSFHTQTLQSMQQLLVVNCCSQLVMTHIILPKLLKQGHRSAIINLSSSSIFGTPYFSVYGATKSFNNSLSYQDKIDILSLHPSFVVSQMTRGMSGFFLIDTDSFIQSGLKQLGRQRSCFGHWKHQLQRSLRKMMPESWFKQRMDKFYNNYEQQRTISE